MKKLLKIIRSRFLISALVILLEFIQLLIVFTLLYEYSTIIFILGHIFYIGVFLYIINKYESPEFKLPWIIIIMLFSVVGAFVFMLLTSNNQNKRTILRFKNNKESLKPYLEQDETIKKLEDENRDAYLQANYVKKSTGLPCYKNTKISYYKIGEDFHKELLNSLKEAKDFIFMEYFIIEEGKMWNSIYEILKEKVKNGVKVYVIYDDFGCMTTLDEKYYKKLSAEGICCNPTNKFAPVLSRIHNNRDHRKITVIDGTVGFTGGINLADEYINSKVKHGHWKDTAIKLEGEAVKSLAALFLEMWNTQSKIQLEPDQFMKIEYKEIGPVGVVAPYGDGPEDFYKDDVAKYVYLNMINSAKKYIYITTPYLICDYEILNTLCVSAKKGVDVRIIVPHIPDKKTVFWMTQSNYETLVKNGVKIYEYTPGFIHAKQFICDDIFATCGTVNLDYRSLAHHFECGIWMYKTECIESMKKDFMDTINISKEIKDAKNRLASWKKLIVEVMKVFFPLF
ncbi:MAG: cardiolipin synthase [Clostridia bacterium]|nr:cardiolipin synthase [Clostridia bacterium]